MSEKKVVSKKRIVEKEVNKQWYPHWKSGKTVGPYKRKFKQFPDRYVTQRIDPRTGELRWVLVTKIPSRGGVRASVSIKYLDQKPRGVPEVPISREEAKKAFENQPLKSRIIDLQHRAKKVYPPDQVTSRYTRAPDRSDVEGVDTPPNKLSPTPIKLGIKTRYKIDLMKIEGDLSHIPKDIPPSQDKGIYLEKAIHDIDEMIKEYEQLKQTYRRDEKREIDRMITDLKWINSDLKHLKHSDRAPDKDPEVFLEKASGYLESTIKENEKRLQTKKSVLSKQKTEDEIRRKKKLIAMIHMGQQEPSTLEERLKDSQALLDFLKDKIQDETKWDIKLLQSEIDKELENYKELETAIKHQKEEERKKGEGAKKELTREQYEKEDRLYNSLEIETKAYLGEDLLTPDNYRDLDKKESYEEYIKNIEQSIKEKKEWAKQEAKKKKAFEKSAFYSLSQKEKEDVIDKAYETDEIENLEQNIEKMKSIESQLEKKWHDLIAKNYPKDVRDKAYKEYMDQKKEVDITREQLKTKRDELYEKYAKIYLEEKKLKDQKKEPKPEPTKEPEHIAPKDCAKLIREELRKEYPNSKFSVTTKTYAGGSSIDVKWEDDISEEKINKIIKKFEGAGFDSQQDIKTYKGTVTYEGKPVTFGVDYVFAERTYSDKAFIDEANEISKQWGLGETYKTKNDVLNSKRRIGNDWLSNYVYQELRKKDIGKNEKEYGIQRSKIEIKRKLLKERNKSEKEAKEEKKGEYVEKQSEKRAERREKILQDLKTKNSELSKEELNQLADQIEFREIKNKKMLLFLYKKLQSEGKADIESLKNEALKKTKITPEEFDVLIRELKKENEIKGTPNPEPKKKEPEIEVKEKIEEKKSDTVINGHVVKTVDLRPIGNKDEKMCIRCGARGLRTLQKTRCFDTELPSEKYPYKNPNNQKKCIYCGEVLSAHNVYMWKSRKDIVDKCESCTDKLESGREMNPY